MRRFLRGLCKVDLAPTLAVAIALCVVEFSHLHPTEIGPGANSTAAQANLQTAMTGAATFYASNHDSYVGIDGRPQLGAGVSSISEIEIGLTFISGQPQLLPEPNIISICRRQPLGRGRDGLQQGDSDLLGHSQSGSQENIRILPGVSGHRYRWHVLLLPWRLVVIGGLHGGNVDADGAEHERVPDRLSATLSGRVYRRPNNSGDSFFGAISTGTPIRSQTVSTSDACSVRKTSLVSDGPRSIRTPT